MTRPEAGWGATVGAVLAYTIVVLAPIPPPLYFPRLGAWGFLPLAAEPAIRWYGLMIYTAAGGLFGGVIGRFINRRPPWVVVLLIAAMSLLVLAWHERQWFLK